MMINWNSIPATYNNAMSYLEMLGKALTQIQTNTDDIENLRLDEEQLDQNTADIADLQAEIANVTGQLTAMQNSISDIQGDITSIQGSITTLNGDIVDINTAIHRIDTMYDTLSQTIIALDRKLLNDYYTKTESDGRYLTSADLTNYVTDTELSTTLNDYVSDTELSTTLNDYVTNSALTTELVDYVTTSTLTTDYYDKQEVDTLISTAGGGYTKEEIDDVVEPNIKSINELKSLKPCKYIEVPYSMLGVQQRKNFVYYPPSGSDGAFTCLLLTFSIPDDVSDVDYLDLNLIGRISATVYNTSSQSTSNRHGMIIHFCRIENNSSSINQTNYYPVVIGTDGYLPPATPIIRTPLLIRVDTSKSSSNIRIMFTLYNMDGTIYNIDNTTTQDGGIRSMEVSFTYKNMSGAILNRSSIIGYYNNGIPNQTILDNYYAKADADQDGSITPSDALLIRGFYESLSDPNSSYTGDLAGWTQYLADHNVDTTQITPVYPDADRNGVLDVYDWKMVVEYAANVIAQTFTDTKENWYKFSIGEL